MKSDKPQTPHLSIGKPIDDSAASSSRASETTELSDAEYIRAMKREGFPSACVEQLEHNKRLERIATYLEGITCPKQ